MKIPNIEKYDTQTLIDTLQLEHPSPLTDRYIVVMSDKDKITLIKQIETIIRRSLEYKEYIKFLKDEIDMSQCSFFNNVTNKNGRRISIEIHHEPFTLFDIVNIVVNKWIDDDMDLNPLIIAEEVMKLHYQNKVGLIPLSVTVHQLVHDGKLCVPLQNVYGNYINFVEEYGNYIGESLKTVLHTKLTMSKELEYLDVSVLEKKYTYLEVDGFTLPQLIE